MGIVWPSKYTGLEALDIQSRSTTGSDTLLFASFYKTPPDQTNTLKHTQEPGYVTFVTSS